MVISEDILGGQKLLDGQAISLVAKKIWRAEAVVARI